MMKILIVEDEQRAREGLVKLLKSIPGSHEIVGQAPNGEVAISLIRKYKPDVVFADIMMPNMDGLTMSKRIREYGLNTELVIVSAYADFKFAQQSIDLGVCEYILKPVTRKDAENTLQRLQKRLDGERRTEEKSLKSKYAKAHPIVLDALDLIEKMYSNRITQKELADQLEISSEYFSYLFSRNIGKNFSVFLREYRIEQAMRLYRGDICDKREVPYLVGYTDEKYFSQVFRKVVGMTPSEYRISVREEKES